MPTAPFATRYTDRARWKQVEQLPNLNLTKLNVLHLKQINTLASNFKKNSSIPFTINLSAAGL